MCPSRTVDRLFRAGLVLLVLATGCGQRNGGAGTQPGDLGAAPVREQETGIDWSDPEPPGAQALAESVVDEPFNEDKRKPLVRRSTTLTMHITTLVPHTTGLTGFGSSLVSKGAGLSERLQELGAQEGPEGIRIRLAGSVLFDFDSDRIRPDAERTLREVVTVLKELSGRPVRIEGHTDSIASEEYNQQLSERRAAAVLRWLVEHGVDEARLRAVGFGETRPVADNSTAEGRQKNRRVEIVVEP